MREEFLEENWEPEFTKQELLKEMQLHIEQFESFIEHAESSEEAAFWKDAKSETKERLAKAAMIVTQTEYDAQKGEGPGVIGVAIDYWSDKIPSGDSDESSFDEHQDKRHLEERLDDLYYRLENEEDEKERKKINDEIFSIQNSLKRLK